MHIDTDDFCLREHPQAAQYTGLNKYKLRRLRKDGNGPPFIKQGNTILYRKSDLDAWLRERTFRANAERPMSEKQRAHLERLHASRRANSKSAGGGLA